MKKLWRHLRYALGFDVEKKRGVYGEWCRDPDACVPRGYCPKNPTCAD